MPNKTIYVSDSDLALYERAQELARGNLSAAVAQALRSFVEVEGGREQGYEQITVRVGSGRALRGKRFFGRLLGEWRHPAANHRIEVLRVYETRRGRLALHVRRHADWEAWSDPAMLRSGGAKGTRGRDAGAGGSDWWGPSESSLEVAESLEALRERLPPEFFEALAAAARSPALEDLDI